MLRARNLSNLILYCTFSPQSELIPPLPKSTFSKMVLPSIQTHYSRFILMFKLRKLCLHHFIILSIVTINNCKKIDS